MSLAKVSHWSVRLNLDVYAISASARKRMKSNDTASKAQALGSDLCRAQTAFSQKWLTAMMISRGGTDDVSK